MALKSEKSEDALLRRLQRRIARGRVVNAQRYRRCLWRKAGVGGEAVCFRGRGVQIEFVAGRFMAGETIRELAADYDVPREAVETVLRLILVARGRNLDERRARAKVDAIVELEK